VRCADEHEFRISFVTPPDLIRIKENVPLAPLTTLKVGGPARLFARAESEAQVVEAFEYADKHRVDVFVLGGGSNILVADSGFDGLVLQVALKGVKVPERSATGSNLVTISSAAGEDWDEFVEFCVVRNLAGIECLSGIPGFVGGTPVQNVGAYGQEVSESIVSVRCYDRVNREIVDLSNSECGFTYRTSIFNFSERDRYVVLQVEYNVAANGKPKLAYKDLKEYFSNHQPSLLETRRAVREIRRAKSMVIDPADPNRRSAGSFFKNPIVDQAKLENMVASFDGGTVPHFPTDDDRVKIPAAWLIEHSGFHKGYRSGNAGISTNHSLALVNLGDATAAEIVGLKEKIQHGVSQKFDILLHTEPVFVGFD
jgi:UDP-N-acetylmuramate dehydrogenase